MKIDSHLDADVAGDIGVFHVVQRFPVTEASGLLPLLFTEVGGHMRLHEGGVLWARSRIINRNDRRLFTDLRTLGRVHDFQQVAWLGEPVRDEDREVFVGAYLDARYHGTLNRKDLTRLCWKPVAYDSVRSEFRCLARYFEFQNDMRRWQDEGFSSALALEAFRYRVSSLARARKNGFFIHLAQSRARWSALFGDGNWVMPDLSVREANRSGSTISFDRTIDLDELRLLIRSEPNPAYKALFTLLGFGGVRISESLHMWQDDVLPASLGTHLAGYPQDTLFLVVAHPAESRYLGDFARRGETRLQYLAQRYGLRPRHHLQGYRRVGWKNPLETDRNLRLSQVFWSDKQAAHEFAEFYAEIRHFHSRVRTNDHHPYLFVNMNPGEGFGKPIAYAKAREALYRACRRIGLKPSVSGRRIHGLRHAYKKQLTDLGLPKEFIRICLRHVSIESQDDYGQTLTEIRSFLSAKLDWKMAA